MTAEDKAYTHDRKQSGFSLTELLVTLAILMLVTSIMAAGAPAALRAYMGVVDASNANILLTTTATRLRDELSMADPDNIELEDGKLESFVSLETGYRISFTYDADGYLQKVEKVEKSTEDESVTVETSLPPTLLVPKKFSTAAGSSIDLRTTYNKITYENGVFTVDSLKVVKMNRAASTSDDAGGLKPSGSVVGGAKYTDFKIRVLAAAG